MEQGPYNTVREEMYLLTFVPPYSALLGKQRKPPVPYMSRETLRLT
jgi:hypothetical protein